MKVDKNSPIGFLDSGIGGVTVLARALELMPNENYYFYSDSINNPYGDKSDEEIISICDRIVGDMVNNIGCKAIVLACNTASAKAAAFLREKYTTVPIFAIEPAYKMVNDYNPNGRTLVMATRGTIESEKFHRLYSKYDNHNTELISCVGMADLIEQSRFDELDIYLKDLLGKYENEIDNVVLGCTHYPIAKENIKRVLGDVRFFDGAYGISKLLCKVLSESDMLNDDNAKITFVDSSPTPELKKKTFFDLLKSYK